MTTKRTFKQTIRERMTKTGERYTTARANLLQKHDHRPAVTAGQFLGLIDGYASFGGVQGDTAVLHNVFQHAGIVHPKTKKPYSEAMINGLCGGLGFLYAVFEYKGHSPMLTIVMRSKSMPDTFIAEAFRRVGVTANVNQTSSAKVAAKALDEALAAGKPAICVVDSAMIPYYGIPEHMAGMGPQHVAVVGQSDGFLWLDDRAVRPTRIGLDQLTKARGAYRAAKHSLITLGEPVAKHEWQAALREGINDTIVALVEGGVGVPDSFRVNCGFSGMEKWRKLLTDPKDKKGWRKVFADGSDALAGIRRAYDCIQYDYTAPAGGRHFFAEFLDEAGSLLNAPAIGAAAGTFRKAGDLWADLAQTIANTDDDAVRKACESSDRRAELIDTEGSDAADELAKLHKQRAELDKGCRLTAETAANLYDRMAEQLGPIIEVEQEAVQELQAAIAK